MSCVHTRFPVVLCVLVAFICTMPVSASGQLHISENVIIPGQGLHESWRGGISGEEIPPVPSPASLPRADPSWASSVTTPALPPNDRSNIAAQGGQGQGGPSDGTGTPSLPASRIIEVLAGVAIAALGSFSDLWRSKGIHHIRFRIPGMVLFSLTGAVALLISIILPTGGSLWVRGIPVVAGMITGTSCTLAYAQAKERRLPLVLGIHFLGSGVLSLTPVLSPLTGWDPYPGIAASALFIISFVYAAFLVVSGARAPPGAVAFSENTLIGMDMADPRLHAAVLEERYKEIVPIATGGLARVYRAVRRADGVTVAVKIPLTTTETTGRTFLKEMLLWRDLDHPNIVRVMYVAILPVPLVEMEFIGRSLADVTKPVSPGTAIRLIRGIAKGLAYAHKKGIIHRDIKPGNILITPDDTPKITDWGMGRSIIFPEMPTVPGFSLSYAAPEQVAPSVYGGTDHRTDIFQLGVVFYELVTGRLPFAGDDLASTTRAILSRDPPIPSSINPETRPIDAVILRCLAKNPADRFQSVDDMIARLPQVTPD